MHSEFKRNLFFVKEHVGVFKAANNFDIYDPETNQMILHCREEKLGIFTKMLRFSDYKRMTPFHVEIKTPDGKTLLHIKRGVSILKSYVDVLDEHEQKIGGFTQKVLSIGGEFAVTDPSGQTICKVKGKLLGWDFQFLRNDQEIARVTKKWAGAGKELFTSADNYMLEIHSSVSADDKIRQLILATVLCIDMVLKE